MARRAGTLDRVATGLRERKKQAVKTALEQTALRLFMEKGYENTTVEEISEAVDVSTRTFFRYFATKDEVLFAHQAERLAAICRRSSPSGRPMSQLPTRCVRWWTSSPRTSPPTPDLLVVQATVYREARLPGRHHPAAPGRADRGHRDRRRARGSVVRPASDRSSSPPRRCARSSSRHARGSAAAGRATSARWCAAPTRRADPDPRDLTSFVEAPDRRGASAPPVQRRANSITCWKVGRLVERMVSGMRPGHEARPAGWSPPVARAVPCSVISCCSPASMAAQITSGRRPGRPRRSSGRRTVPSPAGRAAARRSLSMIDAADDAAEAAHLVDVRGQRRRAPAPRPPRRSAGTRRP